MENEPKLSRLSALLLVAVWALLPAVGNANPTGATVIAGSVQFDSSTANQLQVTNSPNSIINWNGFSIAANETTRFIQQSANSFVLNRVTGVDQSQIFGQLQSNGRILLINQNGVLFGAGSVIDTAGILASTLNVSDADFLAGNLQFSGNAGVITNESVLRVGSGGTILLIASEITNRGTIDAPDGNIVLAAAKSVTLKSWEDPEIIQSRIIGDRASDTSIGFDVVTSPSPFLNRPISMLARTSVSGAPLSAGKILNEGTIQATNGRIKVLASSFTNVGTIDAQGGSISIDTPFRGGPLVTLIIGINPGLSGVGIISIENVSFSSAGTLTIKSIPVPNQLAVNETLRLKGVEPPTVERDRGVGKDKSDFLPANPTASNAQILTSNTDGGVIVTKSGGLVLAAGKSLALSSWDNPTVQFEIRASPESALTIAESLVNGGVGKIFSGMVQHSRQIKITGLNRGENGQIVISGSTR